MIEEMEDVKFDTDLQPNAIFPYAISDEMWLNQIGKLEFDEMEQLLRHYRTIDDQLKLLELSHNIEELRDE